MDLGFHPLCDDHEQIGSQINANRYHQEIQLCKICLTAHQLHPVKKEVLFKKTYKYRAAMTKDVLSGMQNLVDEAINYTNQKQDKPIKILDVGCNDGSLISLFKLKTEVNAVGVDPTDAIEDSKNLDLKIKDYFNEKVSKEVKEYFGGPADIITFTNVFAHIENLGELCSSLKLLIGKNTLVIIENHYLGSIIERFQIDTFYHEHPRTYSATSFKFIAKLLGLELTKISFPSRYGGNIRVVMKQGNSELTDQIKEIFTKEISLIDNFGEMQSKYTQWVDSAKKIISSDKFRKGFRGKGLPGRAVMLISALGISSKEMPKVYEQDLSPKVGYYVPGTNIEINSDSSINPIEDTPIVLWPWHIAEEVIPYLANKNIRGEVWVPLPEFKKIATL